MNNNQLDKFIMQKNKSEFGRGLCYCLALFLCHSEREYWATEDINKNVKKIIDRADMWFNGASDHLYDLQIPEDLPLSLKKRLAKLCGKAIHWGVLIVKTHQPKKIRNGQLMKQRIC